MKINLTFLVPMNLVIQFLVLSQYLVYLHTTSLLHATSIEKSLPVLLQAQVRMQVLVPSHPLLKVAIQLAPQVRVLFRLSRTSRIQWRFFHFAPRVVTLIPPPDALDINEMDGDNVLLSVIQHWNIYDKVKMVSVKYMIPLTMIPGIRI